MTELKFMRHCDLCNSEFQHGPHRYDGRHIPKYDLLVCSGCYEGNWDGWGGYVEAQFLMHLRTKGLPVPARNAKGFFPRD
jgi:hypothetical protein